MDELEERVLKAVSKVLKGDRAGIDDSFESLGVDSLDAIEILFEVEEEFDISIPSEAAKAVLSVRDVADGVRKILAGEDLGLPSQPDGAGAS